MTDARRPRPSRRRLALVLVPIGALLALGAVGTALTPVLAVKHPLVLIVLEARNRNLVLARHVDVVPFVLVGTLRRLVSDPLFFLLGRWYGEAGVRWLERRSGSGRLVEITERAFRKASYPMVFLFPGALVCSLAGATGMSPVGFAVANVAGTVTAVVALRAFGDVFAKPVDAVLHFLGAHLVATTAVTVVAVIGWVLYERFSRGEHVPGLDEIEDELEAEQKERND